MPRHDTIEPKATVLPFAGGWEEGAVAHSSMAQFGAEERNQQRDQLATKPDQTGPLTGTASLVSN